MQKNKPLTIIILIILVVLFLLWVTHLWPFSYMTHRSGDKSANSDHQGVPVAVIQLKKESIALTDELPGRIVPYQVADIRPQVSGIISERLFQEGSQVKEGAQLYQIDPAIYKAAYNVALAALRKAQANLNLLTVTKKRYDALIKAKVVSQQDYDTVVAQFVSAKADVGVAKANLDTTKINLDYTKMLAPITGRISKSEVTKGALVTANQPTQMARITQLDPIYVDMTQSNEGGVRLQKEPGIAVVLFLEDKHQAYQHEGKLEFSDITVDETTGTVMLRALFPNPNGELLPGSFVRAHIKFPAMDFIVIPQKALIRHPDGSASVWLVDNKNKANLKANLKTITAKRAIGDKWLVTEGLSEGDIIITEGFQKLMPGVSVRVER